MSTSPTNPEASRAKTTTDQAAGTLLAVGAEVLRARNAAGLTQAELAARMDTTLEGVAALEAGRRAPSVDFLVRIADACDARLTVQIRPRSRFRRFRGGR